MINTSDLKQDKEIVEKEENLFYSGFILFENILVKDIVTYF
jgi:hypothetical protein